MAFPEFMQEWRGKRIADPLLGSLGLPASQWYQCVSLIKQYLREDAGINVDWPGNAIQFWTATNALILTKFDKIPSQEPIQGDIVILRTAGRTDFLGEGHIGIATGNNDSVNAEILEQNGATGGGTGMGGDAIRTRSIPKSRIAGLLRLKPIAPIPPSPTYQVTETYPEGRQIKLNKQPTNLWGMNYHFDYMKDHPVEVHNQDEIWTIMNKVHHEDGYDYYRRAGQVDGFNTLDCDDYTPPPPIPYFPPSAPVTIPVATQNIRIIKTLFAFPSATDAANRLPVKAVTTLPTGIYLVLKTGMNGMLYIAKTLDSDLRYWINPADNVVDPPIPTPPPADTSWKATYTPMNPDRKVVHYIALQTFPVQDLSNVAEALKLISGHSIGIYGTFTKNGVLYGRPKTQKDVNFIYWYGIPLGLNPDTGDYWIEPQQVIMDSKTTVAERQMLHTTKISDYLPIAAAGLQEAKENTVKFFDIILRRKPKK